MYVETNCHTPHTVRHPRDKTTTVFKGDRPSDNSLNCSTMKSSEGTEHSMRKWGLSILLWSQGTERRRGPRTSQRRLGASINGGAGWMMDARWGQEQTMCPKTEHQWQCRETFNKVSRLRDASARKVCRHSPKQTEGTGCQAEGFRPHSTGMEKPV